MGFPVDIFTTPPPDSYICTICHDVLKDAVSFKECGHIFCNECAEPCIRSKSCPTCRASVSDTNPAFIVKEVIGSMQVKCPHGSNDDQHNDGSSNKRSRGDDGSAVREETCDWVGECVDLQKHESLCNFKVITCDIEGCNHQCQRKDIERHLSGSGLLYHMNLMQSSYEKKMKDLQSNFDKKLTDVKSKLFKVERELIESKGKNKSMEKKISVLQMKFKSHLLNESINSDAQVPDGTIKVSGAGIVQVNGLYIEHGKRDGVPQYVKTGIWDGSDVIFKLLRDDGWYILMYISSIVDPDIAFYVHTNDDDTPPKKAGKMTMKV